MTYKVYADRRQDVFALRYKRGQFHKWFAGGTYGRLPSDWSNHELITAVKSRKIRVVDDYACGVDDGLGLSKAPRRMRVNLVSTYNGGVHSMPMELTYNSFGGHEVKISVNSHIDKDSIDILAFNLFAPALHWLCVTYSERAKRGLPTLTDCDCTCIADEVAP